MHMLPTPHMHTRNNALGCTCNRFVQQFIRGGTWRDDDNRHVPSAAAWGCNTKPSQGANGTHLIESSPRCPQTQAHAVDAPM